jgi:signal recognition particle GTPase
MADRILGMGDVRTLIEKAEEAFDEEQKSKRRPSCSRRFHLRRLPRADAAIKKMGSLSSLIGMIPGMPKELKGAKIGDDELSGWRPSSIDDLGGASPARVDQRQPPSTHRQRERHVYR